MIREQRIMKDIVEKLGNELDDYITTFYNCDLWYYKENELIVNKTFKEIISIVASYYLTTADEVLKNAFKLINSNNEATLSMLSYMGELHLRNGSESILNRVTLFCFALYEIFRGEKKKPTEILEIVYNYDLAEVKESWLTRFKYKIGYYKHPYKLNVNSDGLMLMSLLSGKSLDDAFEYMLLSYNIN